MAPFRVHLDKNHVIQQLRCKALAGSDSKHEIMCKSCVEKVDKKMLTNVSQE